MEIKNNQATLKKIIKVVHIMEIVPETELSTDVNVSIMNAQVRFAKNTICINIHVAIIYTALYRNGSSITARFAIGHPKNLWLLLN